MSTQKPKSQKPNSRQPTLKEFRVEEFDLRRREAENTDEDNRAILIPSETSGRQMPGSQKFDPKSLDTATIDRVIEKA